MARLSAVIALLEAEPVFQWYRARWIHENGQPETALNAYVAQLYTCRAEVSNAACVQFVLECFAQGEADWWNQRPQVVM